jgi:hypothetical protein
MRKKSRAISQENNKFDGKKLSLKDSGRESEGKS